MDEKLFYFSRIHENLIEFPYAVIVVGNGCPAGCDLCSFSNKVVKDSECFDYDIIKSLIEKVDKIFFEKFEILFHGINLLTHPFIDDIIGYTKNILKRGVRLQLEHSMSDDNIHKINNLIKKYGKLSAIIRINVKKQEDFNLFYNTFKDLAKIEGLKIYFEIFLDRNKFSQTIEKIMNWSTCTSNNEFNCIVGNKFDIKFHNYIWKLNRNEEKIDNIDNKTCYMYDYFDVKNNQILINDHIEVQNNGDFIFHDDLCYIGQAKISNINKSKNDIYNDFLKYKFNYLENLRNNSDKSCYKCIMNKYHFDKKFDLYKF